MEMFFVPYDLWREGIRRSSIFSIVKASETYMPAFNGYGNAEIDITVFLFCFEYAPGQSHCLNLPNGQ